MAKFIGRSSKTILVTGGAGFIGSHLVDDLVKSQMGNILVYDNFSRGREENLAKSTSDIELIRGDITDRDHLRKVMQDVDLVYHLAAQSNVLGAVSNPDSCFFSNVIGTYDVLSAALSSGAVHVGSERAPEVGYFVADISSARKHFGLESPEDPISHLESLLEQFRSRVSV